MFDFPHNHKGALLSLVFGICLLAGCSLSEKTIPTDYSIDFSHNEQQQLMGFLRTGKMPSLDTLQMHANETIVLLRDEGRRKGFGYGTGGRLLENIEQAKQNAVRSTRGFSSVNNLDTHLFILSEWQNKDSGYVHGLHALKLTYQGQEIIFWPTYAIETNRDYKDVLTYMCRELEGNITNCDSRGGVTIWYSEAIHIAQSPDDSVYRSYYRGKVLEDLTSVLERETVVDIVERGLPWLRDNIEGDFTYVYNPSSGVYSKNNNMIRQFMASRLLAEMAHDDAALLVSHKANLRYIFDHWYQEENGQGYVWYKNKSKLGAIALLLRALVASPIVDEYMSEVDALTAGLLSLLQEDGSWVPWYIAPDYAYDTDYLLTFYSGEAIVALVELYERFGDEAILSAAIRAQDFYLQRYVEEIEDWYYPAYVPRHTLSLYKLYHITQDSRYADAIFVLNDKLIAEMLHTDTRGIQDIVGRFYNPVFRHYGTPHSASDGVYVEGLIYAYMLAEQLNDTEHTVRYAEALRLGIHNLAQLQYRQGDMYFMAHPERVAGAIRFGATDNRIRTDTTQHALDGLTVLAEYLEK